MGRAFAKPIAFKDEIDGYRGVYHRAGRRPDPLAPPSLRVVFVLDNVRSSGRSRNYLLLLSLSRFEPEADIEERTNQQRIQQEFDLPSIHHAPMEVDFFTSRKGIRRYCAQP